MKQTTRRDLVKERFWRGVFRAWKSSGLTRRAFCLREKLILTTFDHWRDEIARRDAGKVRTRGNGPSDLAKDAKTPVLLPMTIVHSATLEVVLPSGRCVHVPPGFDPAHLRAVLSVLEERAC